MILVDGAAAADRRLNRAGYAVVVVTNQPVIARGDCSERKLGAIHAKLETLLGEQGAYLDAIFYCPHHPDRGYRGERPELKCVCACRKPGTEMIDRACAEINLDRARSWLVGDSATIPWVKP